MGNLMRGNRQFDFVRANMALINDCFSPALRNNLRLDQTPQAKQLVETARKVLSYDATDSDLDVFMSVVHVWLDIKKIQAQRRHDTMRLAAEPEPTPYGEQGEKD